MLFTSYEFFGFVVVLFLAYYLLPKQCQWPLLLAASYLFYAAAGPQFLPYLLATTAATYLAGRGVGRNLARQSAYLKEHKAELSKEEKKAYKDRQKRLRLRWVAFCLLVDLGILVVVKYTGFLLSNVSGALSLLGWTGELSFVSLALPLGISFYTFQAVGYLIDVYRGTVPAEENPFKLALFLSFFPQLIQGPISRFGDLSKTLYGPHPFDRRTLALGLQRVLWGYFKKMVLADRVIVAVTTLIGEPGTYAGAWVPVGMLLYTFQLYADFTGGIDITIGLAQALGIHVEENFNRPYFSKSLKEYWRRWHISMCSWFRDYLFYPLSVSKAMQRFTKFSRGRFGEHVGRRLPVYVSTFTVWLATGIWHGASWNFIVWGLLNWAIMMVSEELEPLYERFHSRFSWSNGRGWQAVQVLRTFGLVCVLNYFDCFSSLGTILGLFASLFTASNWSILWDGSLLELGLTGLDYGILAVGAAVLLGVSLVQRSGSVRAKVGALPYPARFVVWYGLFLVVLLMGAYGIGYDASQFIYNQF